MEFRLGSACGQLELMGKTSRGLECLCLGATQGFGRASHRLSFVPVPSSIRRMEMSDSAIHGGEPLGSSGAPLAARHKVDGRSFRMSVVW